MRQVDLIERQEGFFNDFGFKLDRSLMVFKKPFSNGEQLIFIHYSPYTDGAYLEYNLGIRNNEVEMMIHKFLPSLHGYSDRSVTLVQTLDKIGKELPKRFFIENSANLSRTLMNVEKFFVSYGFNWLDEMSDPLNLESLFAGKKEKKIKTQNFIYNAFRGTALSRLYKPSDYPVLRDSYLKLLKQYSPTPFDIASYLRFLNYLDKDYAR